MLFAFDKLFDSYEESNFFTRLGYHASLVQSYASLREVEGQSYLFDCSSINCVSKIPQILERKSASSGINRHTCFILSKHEHLQTSNIIIL